VARYSRRFLPSCLAKRFFALFYALFICPKRKLPVAFLSLAAFFSGRHWNAPASANVRAHFLARKKKFDELGASRRRLVGEV
jgi:hypothetical protein